MENLDKLFDEEFDFDELLDFIEECEGEIENENE